MYMISTLTANPRKFIPHLFILTGILWSLAGVSSEGTFMLIVPGILNILVGYGLYRTLYLNIIEKLLVPVCAYNIVLSVYDLYLYVGLSNSVLIPTSIIMMLFNIVVAVLFSAVLLRRK